MIDLLIIWCMYILYLFTVDSVKDISKDTVEAILDEVKPIYRMKIKPNLSASPVTRSGERSFIHHGKVRTRCA